MKTEPKTEAVTENAAVDKKVKRKRRNRIFLRILAIFLAVLLVFVGTTTTISIFTLRSNLKKINTFSAVDSDKLEIKNYDDGCWNIYSDRDLKVLQLTDIHFGGGWMSYKKDAEVLNTIAAIVTAEKPDLVIATGDIAYPVPFQAGTFNNKSGAILMAELMEKLGVYWTLCFGNHDTEAYSYFSREDISEFYMGEKYEHCLFQKGPENVDGCGNQVINIVNSDNIITRSLILLDSHSYIDGDYLGINWKYDNIHDNQIEWYKNTIASLNKQNDDTMASLNQVTATKYAAEYPSVKTSVFMHIPMSEYKTAWNEYAENGCKDTENVKYNYGEAGETGNIVYCGIHEDQMFETMLSIGSTDSVFSGHDHLNNFSLNYRGINLTYGMSIDYLAYPGISNYGAQRGCTVLNYKTDGTIDFESQNYYQDKYSPLYEKETVLMTPYYEEETN